MKLKTPEIKIGTIKIGGQNPIAIQSMTNTDTSNVKATVKQSIELIKAGSEMIRVTVNDEAAAKAVPKIRRELNKKGFLHIPLIGDFHFNGHELLTKFPDCATSLDKYRINPGNVGFGRTRDQNFETMIKIAIKNRKPVRIGVNHGSLDRDLFRKLMDQNAKQKNPLSSNEITIKAVVESALKSATLAEKIGLPQNKIVISVKMSDVQDVVSAYELLAKKMIQKKHPYALHLGLTEAGSDLKGLLSSSAALSILLQQGIGDTIRISLTPDKNTPRTREVEACRTLLQSLGLRYFMPQITSCPGCGRTDNTFFQDLAAEVNSHIKQKFPIWKKKYPGIEKLKIAVMGCVVNGPGESTHADIGISLPGKGEQKIAVVYAKGKFHKNLKGKDLKKDFLKILEEFVAQNY